MRKKKKFFRENYKKCREFLENLRWYFVFSTALFFFLFLVGFTFPIFFRESILNIIRELISSLDGKGLFSTILFIFFNNLKTSFFAMTLGIGAGLFPIIIISTNGYILGFVSRFVMEKEGAIVIWRLLPHGIFELPAIIFSVGIGLKLGISIFKGRKEINKNFIEAIRFFIFVIIPLLFIAGIIEGSLIFLLG